MKHVIYHGMNYVNVNVYQMQVLVTIDTVRIMRNADVIADN